MTTTADVGLLVRRWRERRRRSQLDVSVSADVSARHLSFIETGRATPSRAMIERLCDELDVPLREPNAFYLAAGLAPGHGERALTDLGAAASAVDAVLRGHEPNPAVAVNAHWDLLAANRAMTRFLADIPTELTGPPLKMLRVTMHPNGLAGRLRNSAQWRAHALRRVRRQLDRTADPALAELDSYPAPDIDEDVPTDTNDIVVPMQLAAGDTELALLYAVTVFGAPRDVTLDEIAIETFFPAGTITASVLRAMADGVASASARKVGAEIGGPGG